MGRRPIRDEVIYMRELRGDVCAVTKLDISPEFAKIKSGMTEEPQTFKEKIDEKELSFRSSVNFLD